MREISQDKKIIVRLIFVIWIAVWLLYLVKPYFKRDLIGEYKTLLSRPLEGKWSYVTGDELYSFISICRDSMPDKSFTYSMEGLEGDHLGQRRVAYYLYPGISTGDPDYILVYKKPGYGKDGYYLFKKFKEDKYILRKSK